MKRLLIILCCVSGLIANSQVGAQQDSAMVTGTDSRGLLTGLFKSVWLRLQSINPQHYPAPASRPLVTAGIRGAEMSDSLLQPYWKGDLTEDEAFQAELRKLSLAQLKMNQGDPRSALKFFDEFLVQHGQGDLRPNALLGKSISLAGIGRSEQALATMQRFVDEYPNHPMAGEGRRVIAELANENTLTMNLPVSSGL